MSKKKPDSVRSKPNSNAVIVALAAEMLDVLIAFAAQTPDVNAICHNSLLPQVECSHCRKYLKAAELIPRVRAVLRGAPNKGFRMVTHTRIRFART